MGDRVDIAISGGGPAGLMAGLLFARAGLRTLVLEKHDDFLRDFRGDTVHPSTLRLFHELGLLDRLLERPHDKVRNLGAMIGRTSVEIADFYRLDPRWAFLAMMPQWEFLDFVATEARTFANFSLRLGAEAIGLVEERGRVAGLLYREGPREGKVEARLVLAADGRGSRLRDLSGLTLRDLGAPMDVLWFRLPKPPSTGNDSTGIFASGRILVMIDRSEYWQCAFLVPKGGAAATRSAGLESFREEVARIADPLSPQVAAITDWNQVKLLTVALNRLDQWHRPGLLIIGDAAHAMSPIGGVGINLAIQDAVAAANILAEPMRGGADVDPWLHRVERRRRRPVRLVQAVQSLMQRRVIAPLLEADRRADPEVPLPLRLLDRFRPLRAIPAALIGIGIGAEHVRSPLAGPPAK